MYKIDLKLCRYTAPMERNIKQKVSEFSKEFKTSIQAWFKDKTVQSKDGDETKEFLHFIFDYETLCLETDDFKKRKRIKNLIPNYERCLALRVNNERCTRKKKKDCEFCGTHKKGTPYGTIDEQTDIKPMNKITIWLEEINGIYQYIDSNFNVYSTEDMNSGELSPRVIANWSKDIHGIYKINI